MTSHNPLACEQCGRDLEPDDAIAIIEGVCGTCRQGAPSSALPSSEAVIREARAEDLALSSVLDQLAEAGQPEPHGWPCGNEEAGARANARGPVYPVIVSPMSVIAAPRARRRARDLAIGTLVGLVLTVAATAYILLTREGPVSALTETPKSAPRTLAVRVSPPWATVKLGNRVLDPTDELGRVAISLSSEEGWTWLEVAAEGYHSDRRPLSTLGGVEEVIIELVRRPYEVSIQTVPDQAEVWLNNKLKGYSPLTVSLLAHEQPALSIKRRGYEQITQTIAPPERSGQLDLKLTLTPSSPMVRVETDPPGAEISAAGATHGISPLTIHLDPSLLGEEVTITASAPGYAPAETQVKLPPLAVDPLEPVNLTLRRTRIEVEISTTPPGGTVRLDGQVLGVSPVVATFDSTQIGRTVVVQASLDSSHHGRQELTVPPAGDSLRVTVPMEFSAQRVVFILSLARNAPAESRMVSDRLIGLIHGLTPQQRFAVLANTGRGHEAWPGDQNAEIATSEQKVRAYDLVRSLRSGEDGEVREMLSAALAFEPTTICLLAAGRLNQADLEAFDGAVRDRDVAIHVVGPPAVASDEWPAQWAARHNGTFTIIGRDDAPVAVGEANEAE